MQELQLEKEKVYEVRTVERNCLADSLLFEVWGKKKKRNVEQAVCTSP